MKKYCIFFLLTFTLFAEHNYTNALIGENSLYLQQHAHNPVNWYPWGDEAFAKAKKEHKLIFVSLGYSTCHWCHVMEEESFSDIEVAKLLNDNFISIKVDREEYPQLDRKFQRLYITVNSRRGGWPLSVFMLEDAEIIHIETYIPKEEVYGSLGMMKILPALLSFRQDKLFIREHMKLFKYAEKDLYTSKELTSDLDDSVIQRISQIIGFQFDNRNGGFSKRPKFPEVSKIELLLDMYQLRGDNEAFLMALMTLDKMAKGGIYDQLNGGFFRYTTDEEWNIPHFEKMLYTNGELIPLYVRLYKLTKNPLYKRVVDETITQLETNFMMYGLYMSASDADSNGEEGGYFIFEYLKVKKDLLQKGWKEQEVEDVLAYLGIEEDGNIDGDCSHLHITSNSVPKRLEEAKKYLREVSSKREFPFVDKKVITAWNAMMIKALFKAGELDKKYTLLAQKRLESLLTVMWKKETLYHQTLFGIVPKQEALLEDYAFLIDAMIEGYEATYDEKYLTLLTILTQKTLKKFYKEEHWYLSDDGLKVIADFDDRYYSSGLSVMLDNLVRLSSLTFELGYLKVVKNTIKKYGSILEENPVAVSKLVHTYLRLTHGDIIVKTKKSLLKTSKKEIEKIEYPFILTLPEEVDTFLACKVNTCFAYDTNLTKLITRIDKMKK